MNDSRPTKPKRGWYQFSLRTLLLLVVLASIGMSWFAVKRHRAEKQRAAVEAFGKLDGNVYVYYDFHYDADGRPVRAPEPPGPAWLRSLLGVDFFSDVVWLQLVCSTACDADLEHLAGLTKLKSLYLTDTQLTDVGLAHLAGLTKLEWLSLSGTQLTDAGLEHLARLTNLKWLDLSDTQVTDAGLEHLAGLTNLESLVVSDTQVTDAGLEHLAGLTNLKWLGLDGTQVTDEAVEKLQQALPNCEIEH